MQHCLYPYIHSSINGIHNKIAQGQRSAYSFNSVPPLLITIDNFKMSETSIQLQIPLLCQILLRLRYICVCHHIQRFYCTTLSITQQNDGTNRVKIAISKGYTMSKTPKQSLHALIRNPYFHWLIDDFIKIDLRICAHAQWKQDFVWI